MRMVRVEHENENDLEDENYVEVSSEDLDTKLDIASEESEEELDMNEVFVFWKE